MTFLSMSLHDDVISRAAICQSSYKLSVLLSFTGNMNTLVITLNGYGAASDDTNMEDDYMVMNVKC
jgi:hypothetical protein